MTAEEPATDADGQLISIRAVALSSCDDDIFAENADVVVDQFPALPIDVSRLPSLRLTSTEDWTQSTTNINEEFVPENRELKRSTSLDWSEKLFKVTILDPIKVLDQSVMSSESSSEDFPIRKDEIQSRGSEESDTTPIKEKRIRYALFHPENWLYDKCSNDEEFDRRWAAIVIAHVRFTNIPQKIPSPPSPSALRRHSFDR
uniref:Uncharacterized protein n=1 Tax=Heterorhabditis bacteriophora TaxID=37862 RepID=A0A1I7WQG5_HETBA